MPTFTTTAGAEGILPADYGGIVITAVTNASVAAQTTTVIPSDATEMRIPVVREDPAAAWVAEGAEIPVDDPTLDEVEVVPAKVAGLTVISSELALDSTPAAGQVIGEGLARDVARKVDGAFYGSLSAPAPAGLGALSGVTTVSAGSAWTDTDPFAEAQAEAEQEGAVISAFVANPADALTLATLRDETGSNRPLLGQDATVPTRRQILGVPLYVSPAVSAGTVWGYDARFAMVVMRKDVEVVADSSVFFTSDRVAIRAIMRIGFAFPHPVSVVKITVTA